MLILASQSPRRREILEKLGLPFEVEVSPYEEGPVEGTPSQYVTCLAKGKAEAMGDRPEDIIVAADTVVCLDGEILGKPRDEQAAYNDLRRLAGRKHTVYTGVAVVYNGVTHTFCEATEVEFRPMSDRMIWDYIATGDPMDKAGAYGVQSMGGRFVKGIRGDFFNVMGLPLCALSTLFEELGIL